MKLIWGFDDGWVSSSKYKLVSSPESFLHLTSVPFVHLSYLIFSHTYIYNKQGIEHQQHISSFSADIATCTYYYITPSHNNKKVYSLAFMYVMSVFFWDMFIFIHQIQLQSKTFSSPINIYRTIVSSANETYQQLSCFKNSRPNTWDSKYKNTFLWSM